MDSLRVSLIIIGAIILLLLYLGSRFIQGRKNKAEPTSRSEPSFDEQQQTIENPPYQEPPELKDSVANEVHQPAVKSPDAPVLDPSGLKAEIEPELANPSPAEPQDVKTTQPEEQESASEVPATTYPEVIALHVVSGDELFLGTDLVKAANLAAMRFGEMEIFHFQGVTKGDITFSMANMLEPGTFDMDQLESFSTPGVLLFMESRYQADLATSLESMERVARRLCEVLNGQLLDEHRQPMSIHKLEQWKSQLLGNA